LSSDRLVATLIANPPDLLLEEEVIHSDLETLHYDLGDMYKPTPEMEEDIGFQKEIIVKQFLKILLSLETELYSSLWTLGTNTPKPQ
jgi:hypothetical protein